MHCTTIFPYSYTHKYLMQLFYNGITEVTLTTDYVLWMFMLPQKQGATQPPTQPTRLCLLVAQVNETTLITVHKGCTSNMSMFLILYIYFFVFVFETSLHKNHSCQTRQSSFSVIKESWDFCQIWNFRVSVQVLFSCTYLGISVLLKEIKGKR